MGITLICYWSSTLLGSKLQCRNTYLNPAVGIPESLHSCWKNFTSHSRNEFHRKQKSEVHLNANAWRSMIVHPLHFSRSVLVISTANISLQPRLSSQKSITCATVVRGETYSPAHQPQPEAWSWWTFCECVWYLTWEGNKLCISAACSTSAEVNSSHSTALLSQCSSSKFSKLSI